MGKIGWGEKSKGKGGDSGERRRLEMGGPWGLWGDNLMLQEVKYKLRLRRRKMIPKKKRGRPGGGSKERKESTGRGRAPCRN